MAEGIYAEVAAAMFLAALLMVLGALTVAAMFVAVKAVRAYYMDVRIEAKRRELNRLCYLLDVKRKEAKRDAKARGSREEGLCPLDYPADSYDDIFN